MDHQEIANLRAITVTGDICSGNFAAQCNIVTFLMAVSHNSALKVCVIRNLYSVALIITFFG